MITLKSGDIAPKFTLPNHNNKLINLSDFLGKKILLYFYPKAMTPGCIVQACHIRDNLELFKNKKVEVVGISPDKTDKLLTFIEKKMLNFTLLSDKQNIVSKKFGVWGEKNFMGKKYFGIYRTSFLINPSGIIDKIFFKFKCNDHHKIILTYLNSK
ncbi:thioredoxin-dependent thiol peroxidase [Buchnera aphidicola (Rhopalosiphum padi)]|uniref:thioredoxin-dependent peroxiredoxin n=1 Tax=Buchnera aphidicola subsp. Rhopalosiphum padi TaxID=98793 RepID=A0A4D6YFR1_BUCRP|nr:thioredoxin-dependent thiol peroxidase [Buchnera aphidicola]QCI24754.1 thioredoxin-dependent thiol peroxidase [Buchnera aphidicola (Rhopalosiphum padi)]